MQRLVLILIALVPLGATAQKNVPVATNLADLPIIQIPRTPERDIAYALRQVAKNSRIPVSIKRITGLEEGADAEMFREIAYKARATSEEITIRGGLQLCNSGAELTRQSLQTRLVDVSRNAQKVYEDAAAEVLDVLSPESAISLQNTVSALSYDSSEVDIEVLYQAIDPAQFLGQRCAEFAALEN